MSTISRPSIESLRNSDATTVRSGRRSSSRPHNKCLLNSISTVRGADGAGRGLGLDFVSVRARLVHLIATTVGPGLTPLPPAPHHTAAADLKCNGVDALDPWCRGEICTDRQAVGIEPRLVRMKSRLARACCAYNHRLNMPP